MWIFCIRMPCFLQQRLVYNTIKSKMKITVVINTYNASQYLEEVLQSVSGFDEIVVCDMESTDSTLDIARKYGCKIVTFERKNFRIVEPARNFAVQSASNPYVLVVDADEIVTKELKEYWYKCVKESNCPQGLMIPRRNQFMGHYMGGSLGDWQLRFFTKEGTYWPETIHSVPKIQGRVEKIPSSVHNALLIHLDKENLHNRLEKLNRYTDFEVEKKSKRNYTAFALFYRPMWSFIKSYFLQGGIRYGVRGFIKAKYDASYQFFTVAKSIEKRLK